MTLEDFENDQPTSLRQFLLIALFAVAATALLMSCLGGRPAAAQSGGVDLFNRPLPDTISYDFYQEIVAKEGYPTAEDIAPGGFHDNWLACGASIAAYRTAYFVSDGDRYTAQVMQQACEAELQACRDEGEISAQQIGRMLWKPVSENTGKLAILTDAADMQVVVEGATLTENMRNGGPSNGYGSTTRGQSPGCAFGANVMVSFFDSAGKKVFTRDGDEFVIIEDGCKRYELRF